MSAPAANSGFIIPPAPPAWGAAWLQPTPLRRALVLAGFVLLYVALQVFSAAQRSVTFDEPLHLASGYVALAKRDYRFDPTHPPLARMWAAAPLLAMPGVDFDPQVIDELSPPVWAGRIYEQSRDFIFRGPDPDRMLARARFMNILLGAGLGVLLFCWAEAWLGFAAGVIVLAFHLLSPNLASHATLVTTDIGVTVLFFGTVYFLWRTCRRFSAGNVAGLALCFGAAQAVKFSAVLLAPVAGLLLAFAVWRGQLTLRRAAGLLVLLPVTAWLVIWAAYGFRYEPSDTAGWLLRIDDLPMVREHLPVTGPWMAWIDAHHLLPNAYAQGFLLSFASSELQPAYLAGEVSTHGWWYYFPVAMLIKTPIPLLVLAVTGLVCLLARARQLGPDTACFLVVPPAVFLAVAMSTGINIGLRHVLPVYPFALMFAALGARQIFAARWPAPARWAVLGALGGRWVFSFCSVYPFTLTFFNAAVGGPTQGYRYLVDSNLDWGQQLKLLKKWMDRQGVDQINLAYFGMGSPEHNGIKCIVLPGTWNFRRDRITQPVLPGYVAIGATVLSGVNLPPAWRVFYAGFARQVPVAVLGNSLRIYWVEQWPEGDPPQSGDELLNHARLADLLDRGGWHEHALYHYEAVLAREPDNGEVLARRGVALFGAGRAEEATRSFQRAIGLAPENTEVRGLYAKSLIHVFKFQEAAEQARELVRLRPRDWRSHDILGVALAGSGQMEPAAREFRQALRLDPASTLAREHLEKATGQMQGRGF